VLKHVSLAHFNMFTTQQFVHELCKISPLVASMFATHEVCDACIVQSDIKDMYTEISHSDIARCMQFVLQKWLHSSQSDTLTVNKNGRCGVSAGRSKDRAAAASMHVSTICDILIYELHHTFFKVGSAHILKQIIGVAMGSKGGPVLAWSVCMVSEYYYMSSLGSDARYIHTFRYFDDVFQLLLIANDAPSDWVKTVLQSACYPSSLRLIANSMGYTADMLACRCRSILGMVQLCVCTNAKMLVLGNPLGSLVLLTLCNTTVPMLSTAASCRM
jgi:hypothetical protein